MEKKIPLDNYWRVQLAYIKFQARTSSEPHLEYNQGQMQSSTFEKLRLVSSFLLNLGVLYYVVWD